MCVCAGLILWVSSLEIVRRNYFEVGQAPSVIAKHSALQFAALRKTSHSHLCTLSKAMLALSSVGLCTPVLFLFSYQCIVCAWKGACSCRQADAVQWLLTGTCTAAADLLPPAHPRWADLEASDHCSGGLLYILNESVHVETDSCLTACGLNESRGIN